MESLLSLAIQVLRYAAELAESPLPLLFALGRSACYSFPSQIIIVDYAAEKEEYLDLPRIYINDLVAKYGLYRWAVELRSGKTEKYVQMARACMDVRAALLRGKSEKYIRLAP